MGDDHGSFSIRTRLSQHNYGPSPHLCWLEISYEQHTVTIRLPYYQEVTLPLPESFRGSLRSCFRVERLLGGATPPGRRVGRGQLSAARRAGSDHMCLLPGSSG